MSSISNDFCGFAPSMLCQMQQEQALRELNDMYNKSTRAISHYWKTKYETVECQAFDPHPQDWIA